MARRRPAARPPSQTSPAEHARSKELDAPRDAACPSDSPDAGRATPCDELSGLPKSAPAPKRKPRSPK